MNHNRYVHLAARPQVNLRSMGRRRFAHLSEQGDEIHVDANIPWGSTTLFTLEFRDDSRLYAIHSANNRYLSRDGRLLDQCNATCLFSLEYHAGALALRDTQGLYLAPLGSKVCVVLPFSFYRYRFSPPHPTTIFLVDNDFREFTLSFPYSSPIIFPLPRSDRSQRNERGGLL